MLYACEINVRHMTYFVMLSCAVAVAICGSHFELIKNSGQQTGERGTGTFLQKAFFQCDREAKCTHVIQLDGTEEYVMVHGEDALEKVTNARKVWKKMNIDVVRAYSQPDSCQAIYNQGHRINGAYLDTYGRHYCVMQDDGCGPGGWTLAMKINGSTGTFAAESSYWTNDEVYNALSPSLLSDEDAKYPAFNSQRFDSICIGLKKFDTGTTKWLPLFNVSASSLREIFARGDSILTNVGRSKWMALMDNPRMQPHCNTDGLNMKSQSNKIVVRVGFMANNEYHCRSPDSFIGIGISRDFYGPVSAGFVNSRASTGTGAMGYILIK